MVALMSTYIGKCATCNNDRTGTHPQCDACREGYTTQLSYKKVCYLINVTKQGSRFRFGSQSWSHFYPTSGECAMRASTEITRQLTQRAVDLGWACGICEYLNVESSSKCFHCDEPCPNH